jgi:3-hydroxyisobutyrate dehydrogenase-like beta-hydroxyacid dehydrogenase
VAVGFIGLGNIGTPIAQRLVGRPGGLVVFDVRAEACAPFADAGATVASSVADVAKECDVISVMVRDDAQVRDVIGQLLPACTPGTVIAIHSTIREATAVDAAADAKQHGVEVVDAPVTGGFIAAADGTLAVMIGGDAEAYAKCKDVFASWATLVLHVGPVGAGTRAKVARALLTFVGYAAATESQRLAEAAGIDLSQLAAVVRHSDALTGGPVAIMVRDTTAPMTADDPLRPIFEHMYALGAKDLALAIELGEQLGVEVPFSRLAAERLAAGVGLEPTAPAPPS